MKRNGPLKPKTPLKARKPIGRGKPMQKARRKVQKDCRWRSEKYLAWVRQQPCAFCHLGPCDAHHVIGLGWQLSGMGLTAPDSFSMPLCRTHHQLVHADPGMQPSQVHWLRWTIRAALAEFTGETREELTHALAFIEAKQEVTA